MYCDNTGKCIATIQVNAYNGIHLVVRGAYWKKEEQLFFYCWREKKYFQILQTSEKKIKSKKKNKSEGVVEEEEEKTKTKEKGDKKENKYMRIKQSQKRN